MGTNNFVVIAEELLILKIKATGFSGPLSASFHGVTRQTKFCVILFTLPAFSTCMFYKVDIVMFNIYLTDFTVLYIDLLTVSCVVLYTYI
jgi:hypothetical protein